MSAATVVALRPVLRRHLRRPGPDGLGTEPIQGASAVVVEHVNADRGMVKVGGEFWQARALEGSGSYPPGERVSVVDLNQGTAVVWRDDLLGSADRQQ